MLPSPQQSQPLRLVLVGHVDHGKSTVLGRMLADIGALPDGKLEEIERTSARLGKRFEYAFLLDALADERSQGITIDAARIHFSTDTRRYLCIDAPGHVEFLKNMVTGDRCSSRTRRKFSSTCISTFAVGHSPSPRRM